MQVEHEKFGLGHIINSTEVLDEAGNIVAADVMFDHGIEIGVALDEISKNLATRYVDKSSGSYQYAAGKRSDDRHYDAGGKDMRDSSGALKFTKRSSTDMGTDDKTIQKRLSGLQKAHKIIAKEDNVDEAAKNAYAIGMAAAEKSTGDKPPLKKSTIVKGHEIAKGIMKKEDAEEIEEKLIGGQKKIDKNKNGKLDAQDFKMLRKEETEQPVRVTPATSQMRMPALENSIREIMNKNVDLRQLAKEAEFKNRAK